MDRKKNVYKKSETQDSQWAEVRRSDTERTKSIGMGWKAGEGRLMGG